MVKDGEEEDSLDGLRKSVYYIGYHRKILIEMWSYKQLQPHFWQNNEACFSVPHQVASCVKLNQHFSKLLFCPSLLSIRTRRRAAALAVAQMRHSNDAVGYRSLTHSSQFQKPLDSFESKESKRIQKGEVEQLREWVNENSLPKEYPLRSWSMLLLLCFVVVIIAISIRVCIFT